MNTKIITGVIIALVVLSGLSILALSAKNNGGSSDDTTTPSSAVEMADGNQIINIFAKGGYSPRSITAKAGVPTTLKIKTQATYDCSSSLVIPKLNVQTFLKPTGIEEVKIAAADAQGTIDGLCSMGMYRFRITFN